MARPAVITLISLAHSILTSFTRERNAGGLFSLIDSELIPVSIVDVREPHAGLQNVHSCGLQAKEPTLDTWIAACICRSSTDVQLK